MALVKPWDYVHWEFHSRGCIIGVVSTLSGLLEAVARTKLPNTLPGRAPSIHQASRLGNYVINRTSAGNKVQNDSISRPSEYQIAWNLRTNADK